jgi:hypothetical protein
VFGGGSATELSFSNGGAVPVKGDVFLLKATGTIGGGNLSIKINGESYIELIDAAGVNVSSLNSGTSYMIMKIDDFREWRNSVLTGDVVYVLVGYINAARTKCLNQYLVSISDFTSISVDHKIFVLPVSCENIFLDTIILQSFDTSKDVTLLLFSSSVDLVDYTYAVAGAYYGEENFIFSNKSKEKGVRDISDRSQNQITKLSFSKVSYTFLRLISNTTYSVSDTGVATIDLSFEYPPKMV